APDLRRIQAPRAPLRYSALPLRNGLLPSGGAVRDGRQRVGALRQELRAEPRERLRRPSRGGLARSLIRSRHGLDEVAMARLTYVPRPPLSDHVDFFWAFDAYGGPHARERVLPTATSELVVAL